MRYWDITLEMPAANLALDEAVLLAAEDGSGGEILRVWESPKPAVVLGSGCKLLDEVDREACRADGVPILRRSSGGGTVLLGPGCLLFTLVLSYDRDPALGEVRSSYQYILERVARMFEPELPGVVSDGVSDLVHNGLKFSGNAQQRKRHHLLHHGTLLYEFDLQAVSRYLRPPPREPAYRAGRSHEAFLMNVPFAAEELKQRLQDEWHAEPSAVALPMMQDLLREKYTNPEWIERR